MAFTGVRSASSGTVVEVPCGVASSTAAQRQCAWTPNGRPGHRARPWASRLADESGDVLPSAGRGRPQPPHHGPGLILAVEHVAYLKVVGTAVAAAHMPPIAV